MDCHFVHGTYPFSKLFPLVQGGLRVMEEYHFSRLLGKHASVNLSDTSRNGGSSGTRRIPLSSKQTTRDVPCFIPLQPCSGHLRTRCQAWRPSKLLRPSSLVPVQSRSKPCLAGLELSRPDSLVSLHVARYTLARPLSWSPQPYQIPTARNQ